MTATHAYVPEFKLTDEERQQVLLEIYTRLGRLSPDAVSPEQMKARGGLQDLEQNLDAVVDIVRRTVSGHIEPYLAQFLEDIRARCPNQGPTAHCPLRFAGTCALFRYPETIVGATRDALGGIEAARRLS
jgi:hypothetical protein